MRKLALRLLLAGLGLGACAGPAVADDADGSSLTALMSIHTVGVNYELGRYVASDAAEAARWYRKAAELGYPDAQNDLAKLYNDGRGVEQDNVQAYLWYTLAAERGNPCAIVDRTLLERRMSEAEIARADALVGAWQPAAQ